MLRNLIVFFLVGICGPVSAASILIGVGDQNRKALSVENGRLTGVLAKLYQCPLDKSGYSYELQLLPQARMLLQLQRGGVSGGLPLVKLSPRDDYAVFTRSLMEVRFVLYTTKDIELSSDLSAYSFTVLRASASIDLVTQLKGHYTEVSSWEQALKLARLGRFDGAVIPELVLRGYAPESFAGLRQVDFGFLPVSMYVSKQIDNSDELVERLNSAIDQCAGEQS